MLNCNIQKWFRKNGKLNSKISDKGYKYFFNFLSFNATLVRQLFLSETFAGTLQIATILLF